MASPRITELSVETLTHLSGRDFTMLGAHSSRPPGGIVATLLTPMERKGAGTRKNHILFKNVLTEARERLKDQDDDEHRELDSVLEALRALDQEADPFWQHQESGLAAYIYPDGEMTFYGLPFEVVAYASVGTRPYVSPFVPLTGGQSFYILVLDLNEMALYEAVRWSVERLPLTNVPTSLEEAMKFDDPERSLQFHSAFGASGSGVRDTRSVYHGQGVTGDETRNKKIQRFFEMVASGLSQALPDPERPLVLLGPESHVGIYREVNRHPRLYPEVIDLNPSSLSQVDLNQEIQEWVAARDRAALEEKLGTLEHHLTHGTATSRMSEIVKAAEEGKIDTLYVREGARQYGRFDAEAFKVHLHDAEHEGDEELIDWSVVRTFAAGGTARQLAADMRLPEDAPVMAVMRYT